MEIIGLLAQIGAGLWILNVWILRFNKETEFRGGDAKNMLEEFQTYGISPPLMYLIGGTILTLAILLIVGVWVEALTRPAAILLGLLMVGAIGMHLRVGDRIKKAAPAISVLSLSILALI